MSEIPDKILIQDMIESIENILEFTNGMDYATYINDPKTKYAVERNFEILGEAANKLPNSVWLENPEIEWRKTVSLRNRLIHGYFETDNEIIWEIVQNFLKPLKEQLKKLLS